MAAGTPTTVLAALLCLGLRRGFADQVSPGTLPTPSIWADPFPWIPKGNSVTIWCRGSPEASSFRLYKEGKSEVQDMEESPPHSGQARVSIPYMSKDHTGPYLCNYRKSGVWSLQSDPLPLVVTGEFDAPRLSMNPGPRVPAGANVTFSCTATFKSGTFHLLQEGATGPPQKVEPLVSSINGSTLFFIGPVSASHRGTYRCFRSPSSLPYQWSHPSQGLSLEVTGIPIQDHTVENLIRTGLGVLVLVLLVVLLCEACHSEPRHQQGCGSVEMTSSSNWWQEHH